jgi:hypothetical protein
MKNAYSTTKGKIVAAILAAGCAMAPFAANATATLPTWVTPALEDASALFFLFLGAAAAVVLTVVAGSGGLRMAVGWVRRIFKG